jgi:hypothetical protein
MATKHITLQQAGRVCSEPTTAMRGISASPRTLTVNVMIDQLCLSSFNLNIS